MPWTSIQKPSESSVTTLSGGVPIGLLVAITQTEIVSSVTSGWGDISKPTSSVWTLQAKPTSSVWTAIAKPTD